MSTLTSNSVLSREALAAKGVLSPDLQLRLENAQRETSAKNLHVRTLQSTLVGGVLVLSGLVVGTLLLSEEKTLVDWPSLPLPRLLDNTLPSSTKHVRFEGEVPVIGISGQIQRIVPNIVSVITPAIVAPIAQVVSDVVRMEAISVSEVVAPVTGNDVSIARIPVAQQMPVIDMVGQVVPDVAIRGAMDSNEIVAQVVREVIVPNVDVKVVA